MTAAKNVYALMLALVIVLSGCFGNTADDTDAQTPDDTTVNPGSGLEMIAIGGMSETDPTGHESDDQIAATINTTAGQIIQVHEADGGWGASGVNIITECVGGESFDNMPANNYQLSPFYLPGSFTDCTHSIKVANQNTYSVSWSFVYSISPVTVG